MKLQGFCLQETLKYSKRELPPLLVGGLPESSIPSGICQTGSMDSPCPDDDDDDDDDNR